MLFRLLFLFSLSGGLAATVSAQTLHGLVSDAESGRPMENVMVSLMRQGRTIDYALTDVQGRYALTWRYADTLQVSVSYLGYRRETRAVAKAGRQDWRMVTESIALREVEIRPGRIYGRKDTIRYDLTKFASEKDRHVRDVLKRLPGVDVEESGRVTYNGKPIDHFLVEGMDLTGGRYNQIANTLSAKAVTVAEILENYQSVKMLKQKINTDKIALNLRLDPKVRDQWMWGAEAGAGLKEMGHGTERLLWEGGANALQLGKGRQTLYNYKTNNTGLELDNEQRRLTTRSDEEEPALAAFLTQPAVSSPLDLRRVLLNETHTLNANHIRKGSGDRSLRLQAGYTHDERSQERSSTSLYFQPGDTIRMDESLHYRRTTDAAHAELQYEDNSDTYYIINLTRMEGRRATGTSHEVGQRMETAELRLDNRLNWLRHIGDHTWEVRSSTRASWLPARLRVAGEDGVTTDRFDQRQLHLDNSGSFMVKRNGFTQRYRLGLQGEWLRLDHPAAAALTDYSNASLYATPHFQFERGRWLASLSLPVRWQRHFRQDESRLLYAPAFHLRYEPTHRWRFFLSGSTSRSAGEAMDLCTTGWRTDYRTWHNPNGLMPLSTALYGRLYGEYKNTLEEFFITLSLSGQRTAYTTIYEQRVDGTSIICTRRRLPHRSTYRAARLTLSKGLYDWRMKSALDLSVSRSRGRQLTAHGSDEALLQAFRYDCLKAEPKLSWLPTPWLEADYHATVTLGRTRIGGSGSCSSQFDMVHRLSTSVTLGRVEMHLGGEYYRNDLGRSRFLNLLLADASVACRLKKWRVEGVLHNLFNRRTYAYTLHDSVQTHSSRLGIRPREVLVKVAYVN